MPFGRLPLLFYLARAELSRRYAGTAFGWVWALAAPAALVGAMWVALDIGLGMRAVAGPGYGYLLVVGMLPWLALADAVGDGAGSVVRAPHLVKKTVFQVELLPLASVLTAFMVHLALMALVIPAFALAGALSWKTLWMLPFFMALGAVIAAGLAFAAASLNVIVRDTGALVPFLLTIWFWLTPIVWPLSQVPEAWRWLALINPMAVVIEGYRAAILGSGSFVGLADVALAVAVAGGLVALGALVFATLRPSFADAM
jgi:lipopolysaccharide transport system permease protein